VGQAVTVNSGGTYTISGVVAGTYTIEVSLAGYSSGTIQPFTVSSADVTGKNLTLTKLVTGYIVQGYISNKNGTPAVGATVKLRESGSGELADTVTNASGYYILSTTKAAAEYFIKVKGTSSPYAKDSSTFSLTSGVPKSVNMTLNE
jgi:hypothetical protein